MKGKTKILIGDNSADFGVLFRDTMIKEGFDVAVCQKDGEEIAAMVGEIRPDILIMDLFLARLDAISVLQLLRENHITPKQVVVIGHDNEHLEQEVMRNGADYYVLKPVNTIMLCERIRSLNGKAKTPEMLPFSSAAKAADLETEVTDVIMSIGIPAHVKGYHYVRQAIMLSVNDIGMINSVTKGLYPTIARMFDTTPSRVERAIRHAIELAWDRGDVDTLNSYFGYTVNLGKGKPTNSEFIAMISDKLRLKRKNKSGTQQ